MEYKYQGIVIGKRDVSETDRIYTVYTKEKGKIRVLGKGVRKPNARLAGNLETVTQGEIFFAKNRGMGKITGVIAGENFSHIKEDLFLTTNVFYVFRILSQLISDEEEDEEIYYLLESYLKILDNLDDRTDWADIVTVGLLFKIMDRLGYRLEVDRCVRCEKKLVPEKNYLSIARGGILCSNCQSSENRKILMENELIKLIRLVLKNKLENLVKIKTQPRDIQKLRTIIQETISWFSGESFGADRKQFF